MPKIIKLACISIILVSSLVPLKAATCLKGRLRLEELRKLAASEYPDQCTVDRMNTVLDRVFIKQGDSKTKLKFNKKLQKSYLSVAHWNIERGFNVDAIKKIFAAPERYLAEDLDEKKYPKNSKAYQKLLSEIEKLRQADIILLNEVDYGISRTNYQNITREIASTINASYAFATEFIELDPSLIGTAANPDPENYYGLHGNAIISRFPIKEARVLRLPQFYDWFKQEQERLTAIEELRRKASKITFKENIYTEIRRGSRIALLADLELPNGDIITAVSTHLEDRTKAKNRETQMAFLLNSIKTNKNALVLGGDLNSFEFDTSPTSLTKIGKSKLSDGDFLGRTAISLINPYALATNVAASGIGAIRKHRDPTVANIPVILPNKTKGLFKLLKWFKFSDGHRFDSNGRKELSYNNKSGALSNSNQRKNKGFVETIKLERSFKVAKHKIDWLFVKPTGYPTKHYQPAFGRTLLDLNYSYKNGRISDHNPITVDLLI